MITKKSVGFGIRFPDKTCDDVKCPFHGKVKLRGRTFVGTVTSDLMAKSVTVQFERRIYVPKYERYKKAYTKIKAHNPSCVHATTGDKVKIVETRPLSKTKHFVVVEVVERVSGQGKVKTTPANEGENIKHADMQSEQQDKQPGQSSSEE